MNPRLGVVWLGCGYFGDKVKYLNFMKNSSLLFERGQANWNLVNEEFYDL